MKTKIIQKIGISILIIMSGFACLFSPAVQGEINPVKDNSLTSLIMGLIGITQNSNKTNSSGNANTGATGTSTGTSTGNGTTAGTGTTTVSAPSNLVYAGSPFTFTNGSAIVTQTPTVTGTVTGCAASPSLPTGLSINTTTCAISGTPTVNQGAISYTITASNAFGNTTASVSITVNMAAPSNLVYSGSPFTFTNGSPIITQIPTVTGTVTGCVASPSLPTGLILNATTCAISGIPTVTQGANSYTITASNAFGNTTANVSITVSAGGYCGPNHTGLLMGSIDLNVGPNFGNLANTSQENVYSFTASATGQYHIGIYTGSAANRPFFYLCSSSAASSLLASTGVYDSNLVYTISSPGTYYLVVSGNSSNYTGDYNFWIHNGPTSWVTQKCEGGMSFLCIDFASGYLNATSHCSTWGGTLSVGSCTPTNRQGRCLLTSVYGIFTYNGYSATYPTDDSLKSLCTTKHGSWYLYIDN